MMPEPHSAVLALYKQRIEIRQGIKDQTQVTANRRRIMDMEYRIHRAEQQYGRGVFCFRRCTVCGLLHQTTVRACDGKGRSLYQVWLAWPVDLVCVVE